MRTTVRRYNHAADFETVGRFLVRTYRTPGGHVNWLQPRWEYMHFHPLIREVDLSVIGIWEARGEVVGVVHPEHAMGTAYVEIDPECGHLKGEMLRYAEANVSVSEGDVRRLRIFINDRDVDFQNVASEMGYARGDGCEPVSLFAIPRPFPAIPLPPGFRLKSLAEDNDLRKLDRVLWRGFGHDDETPENGVGDREFMQSAPNYRRDLNIVIEAPDGNFVSYCGMWHEPVHSIAYVEPVATDPDYRRMGLGRAAVLEGVRRCGAMGATVAHVGSTQPFYLSIGFRPAYSKTVWQREW